MKVEFKFRHVPASQELTDYVNERIAKLSKFEMKPYRIDVTFSAEKTCQRVDVHVRGRDIELHSHSEAPDFFTGADEALHRMARQLSRKKARVQDHKASKAS
jgi:ribosomal subunit interface protein